MSENKKILYNNSAAGHLLNDQLMVDVIHKIKNGLGGIDGFAALLERDLEVDDPRRRLAERVQEGVKKVNEIAVAVMLLARDCELSHENVVFGVFSKQVITNCLPLSSLSDIDINISEKLAAEQMKVTGDPRSLQRLFQYAFKAIDVIKARTIAVEVDGDESSITLDFAFQSEDLQNAWPDSIDEWIGQIHQVEARLALSVILQIVISHDAEFSLRAQEDIQSLHFVFKRTF